MPDNFNIDELDPEVKSYIERVEDVALETQSELDALKKSIAEAPADDDDSGSDDILKSADPAVVNLVNDLRAEVSKAQETADAERDARVEREFIEKAAGFKDLPVDSADLGQLMKSISEDSDEETLASFLDLIEKMNTALEAANIFSELGSGLVTETGQTKLDELTKSYMGDHPGVSAEEAMVAVLDEDPSLYEDYMAEQEG